MLFWEWNRENEYGLLDYGYGKIKKNRRFTDYGLFERYMIVWSKGTKKRLFKVF